MSGYFRIPAETPEDVFLTYTDWIGYVKDDGTYGYLLKNGVIQGPPAAPADWATLIGKPTTFAPIIGTTSVTAKSGNYKPTWTEINSVIPSYATFNPKIGTGPLTAKAGDWYPSWNDIADKPTEFPGTVSWNQLLDKPTTVQGLGLSDGLSSATFDATMTGYVTTGWFDNQMGFKAAKPSSVTALGTPSGVTVDDVQALYDKVNELLTALKV